MYVLQEEEEDLHALVIYGKDYFELRTGVRTATHGFGLDCLKEGMKVCIASTFSL